LHGAWSYGRHVTHNAFHGERLRPGSRGERQMLSDGVLAWPVAIREHFVDERRGRSAEDVRGSEVAAAHERHAERREESRTHVVPSNGGLVVSGTSLDLHLPGLAAAEQRTRGRRPHARYAWDDRD